jgi:hypothetical protein
VKPRSQQGPKAFHRLHVHFVKAIAVIISCLFPTAMTHTLMRIAPLCQTAVDVVFIRVHTRARGHRRLDERLDGPLLDVFLQANDHLSTALNHAEDRRFLGCECPSPALALEPPAPAASPFFATSSGFPL